MYSLSLPPLQLTAVRHICVRSQTKYPSLKSSGVTAALLTPSLGLGPPPRLETEWTVRQSLDEGVLEGRAPDTDETAVGAALGACRSPLGSITVLMTGWRKKAKWNPALNKYLFYFTKLLSNL